MQVPATQHRRAKFGPFVADLTLRELQKDGCKVNLQEKPFQILAFLLEQPGELVTRQELRAKLWPADTFVDFEHSINTAIKKLREALEDDAEAPRFIETLPRRGYRFIAPVEGLVEEEKHRASLPEPQLSRLELLPARRRPRRYVLPAGAVLLVGAVLLGLRFDGMRSLLGRVRASQAAISPPIRSLAVLPLENLSQDAGKEYFADGLTDALITDLGKLAGLRVISHTSASTYKKTAKPLPQIARELNVDAIVEGTVLHSGGRLRVTVQLVRASPEEHLWAERYERDDDDVIRLERRLALAIAHAITGRVITVEEAGQTRKRAINPKAYDAYLRGRYLWNERSAKPASEAGPHFEEALRLDPTFALAYSGLADYYSVSWGPWLDPARAESYARKAVALEPDLAEAHASLGIATEYQGRFAEAEKELQRAIDLNPNYVMAHHWYAMYLTSMGRLNEALIANDRARRLDPFSLPVNFFRSLILMGTHQYDRAVEQLETAGAINPQAPYVHEYLARIYWIQGQGAKAIDEEVKEANLVKDPARLHDVDQVARTYASAGLRAAELKAARLKEKACAPGSDHDADPLNSCDEFVIASQYGLAGEKEESLYWLKRAARFSPNNQKPGLLLYLKTAPEFDFVRSDPRFRDLLRTLGLPE